MIALHPDLGRIDATRDDLGVGTLRWADIHRKRLPLRCPGCPSGVIPKVSSLGLRFFAHRPGSEECWLADETTAHRLLKVELLHAARAGGWDAELEVSATDGSWRADVLATSPTNGRRIAWEAQLSRIPLEDAQYRTDRYRDGGVEVCWVSDGTQAWIAHVPSLLISAGGAGEAIAVLDGIAVFYPAWCPNLTRCEVAVHGPFGRADKDTGPCPGHGRWGEPGPVTLVAAVGAVQSGDLHLATVPGRDHPRGLGDGGNVVWASPADLVLGSQQEAAMDNHRAFWTEGTAKFAAWKLRKDLEQLPELLWKRLPSPKDAAHGANLQRLVTRQARIAPLLAEELSGKFGRLVLPDARDEGWARGLALRFVGGPTPPEQFGWVPAVVSPVAGLINDGAARDLVQTVVVVADEHEHHRVAAKCLPEQRFYVFRP